MRERAEQRMARIPIGEVRRDMVILIAPVDERDNKERVNEYPSRHASLH